MPSGKGTPRKPTVVRDALQADRRAGPRRAERRVGRSQADACEAPMRGAGRQPANSQRVVPISRRTRGPSGSWEERSQPSYLTAKARETAEGSSDRWMRARPWATTGRSGSGSASETWSWCSTCVTLTLRRAVATHQTPSRHALDEAAAHRLRPMGSPRRLLLLAGELDNDPSEIS